MRTPTDPAAEPIGPLDQALDRALSRALQVPDLPADFRQRLRSAVAVNATQDLASLRVALEREHAAQLEALRSGYVRLRRRTLGTLIGMAFAAGLAVMLLIPWITAHWGPNGVFSLPILGTAIGLSLSLRAWWSRSRFAQLLP